MSDNHRTFVAVVGGLWNRTPAETKAIEDEARAIGEELAKKGFGLVVYASNPQSLEPHVVAGFVKALPPDAGAKSIRVRFAASPGNSVRFAEHAVRPDVFETILFPGNETEAPFYRSLVEAAGVDAVLLVAGAHSTLIAGQIAIARPLPTLAVDKFGGAAQTIRAELARHARDYPSSTTHSIEQSVAWFKDRCLAYAAQHAAAEKREASFARATSQSKKSLLAGLAFLALLVTVAFALASPPAPSLYSLVMIAGLVTSGAVGALVRDVVWGEGITSGATSLVLGCVAGFVVGLAYLIPQFIGAPGVLDPSATQVAATDKIQFVSAVLVALSAGVGFDTIFNRLRKDADGLAIRPPG